MASLQCIGVSCHECAVMCNVLCCSAQRNGCNALMMACCGNHVNVLRVVMDEFHADVTTRSFVSHVSCVTFVLYFRHVIKA